MLYVWKMKEKRGKERKDGERRVRNRKGEVCKELSVTVFWPVRFGRARFRPFHFRVGDECRSGQAHLMLLERCEMVLDDDGTVAMMMMMNGDGERWSEK